MGKGRQTSFGYQAVPTNPEFPSGSKKLVPHEEESIKLKRIFELCLELKSLQALMYQLQYEGILTRDGIHELIVDAEIFKQVQELLASNCNSHKRKYKAEQPSLLASKLYDDNDNIMSPSHAVKKGKRYRYYISQAYLKKRKELADSLPQVPANELEGHASHLIKSKIEDMLRLENYSIEQYQLYKLNLENYLESWSLQSKETHHIVRQIIHKVILSTTFLTYYINIRSLEELFELIITKQDINN